MNENEEIQAFNEALEKRAGEIDAAFETVLRLVSAIGVECLEDHDFDMASALGTYGAQLVKMRDHIINYACGVE